MPTITDREFGDITIRRSRLAKSMRVSLAPDGRLRVSIPTFAPIFTVKRMIASSRKELRDLVSSHPSLQLSDGMTIGKSHSLHVRAGNEVTVTRHGQQLVVTVGSHSLDSPSVVETVRPYVIAALRKEAKHYLPKRLAYLADQHGYSYTTVRFSHAGTRWGSCTTAGTISLNIALMNLSFELIDYVIIHELAHTRQMNHSKQFWDEVKAADPNFADHRKILKNHSPSI